MALKDFIEGRSPKEEEKKAQERKKNKKLKSVDRIYEKAICLMKEKQDSSAIDCFNKAKSLYKLEQDWEHYINCDIYVGLIKNKYNLKEANGYFLNAIKTTLTEKFYWHGIPAFLYLGTNLTEQKQYDLALYNLDIGYKLAKAFADFQSMEDILSEINLAKALKNGQKVIIIKKDEFGEYHFEE